TEGQIVESRISRQSLGVIVAIEDHRSGARRKRSIVSPVAANVDGAASGGNHGRARINLHIVVGTAAGKCSLLHSQQSLHSQTGKSGDGRRIIQRQVVVGG